jgi:hypothetical protein
VLTLAAGTEAAGIDFTIRVPPPFYAPVAQRPVRRDAVGTILGRVVRADGLPVRRARVELSSAERLFSPRSTFTDDDGRYEITSLPPGDYLIEVTDARFTTARFGQHGPTDRGAVVTIKAGETADHIDVSMPRPSAIVGRVFDEYGDPVENVTISARQLRWSVGRLRMVDVSGAPYVRTDDRGRFRAYGLPAGRYVVRAMIGSGANATAKPDDAAGYPPTFFPGTSVASEAQPVEIVADADALNVDFALVPGRTARVSGRALRADGQPFEGVVVLIPSARSGAIPVSGGLRHTTDSGTFAFDNLTPGEYVVQAGTSRDGVSREGEFGLQFVTVAGVDVGDVVVRMSAGSSVAGRITFEGGPPPSASEIELSPTVSDMDFVSLVDNPVARAEIRDDWSFEMHGLNGPRRLTVTRAPDGWMLARVLLHGADITDAAVPFGLPSQSASDVEVVLTNRVTEIAGAVVDERGRPRPDASLVAFATRRSLWYRGSRFVRLTNAASNGAFAIRALPPGDYLVAVIDARDAADAEGVLDNPDFLQRLASDATRVSLADGQHATVDVRPARR